MILVIRHVDRDLTTLSLINLIRVVWVEMWFRLETHFLKNYLGNDVRTTTLIYHQFIVLTFMCDISVEHNRPTPVLIFNNCV